MTCQNCNGTDKLYLISAKCSDLYSHTHLKSGKAYDGYVPDWIGEFGDYVTFTICRHCGTVQGNWPHSNKEMNPYKSGSCA